MEPDIESLQLGMHWFPERAGGLDRMFHALVGGLPDAGVQVRGLVAGSPRVAVDSGGAITSFAQGDAGLRERLFGVRHSAGALLRQRRPDLVASHFALYAAPMLDLTRRLPTVIHFHGPWAGESQKEGAGRVAQIVKRGIERAVYSRGVRHIVLSRAFGEILEKQYGVDPETIRVAPGCVDTARFGKTLSRSEARAMFDLPADRPVAVCVRRLVQRMGLEDLIDAAAVMKRHMPDVLIVLAGKGPLDAALKRRIVERGLEAQVRMLGFVPDDRLPHLYRAADLTIVPTTALEGFGLTTIESLAAGTPVLVTPVGGLPEAVERLEPDLVLASCGAPALAHGMTGAFTGQRRLPDAAACRAYARAHFDTAVVARQVARIYREAIAAF